MAITFIASANYDASSSSTGVCNKPTGTADGDIMFALVNSGNNEYATATPSGWTSLGQNKIDPASWELFYKVASSEGSNYTWTFSGATKVAVTIATYRTDFDTSDPIDVVSNTLYTVNNNSLRAASMNVTKVDSPIFFIGGPSSTTVRTFGSVSVPSSFAKDVDTGSTDSDFSRTFQSLLWSSNGATGTMASIMSGSNADKHAFAVALNPAVIETTILETVSTTENVTIRRTRISNTTDTVSLTESVTAFKGLVFSVMDSVITSETATTLRAMITSIIDTIVSSEIVVSFKKLWTNPTKNTSSFSNPSKNTEAFTNQTKNSSNWSNENK